METEYKKKYIKACEYCINGRYSLAHEIIDEVLYDVSDISIENFLFEDLGGDTYALEEEYDEAIESYLQSIYDLMDIGIDGGLKARGFSKIARIYGIIGKLMDAKEYYEMAKEAYEKNNDEGEYDDNIAFIDRQVASIDADAEIEPRASLYDRLLTLYVAMNNGSESNAEQLLDIELADRHYRNIDFVTYLGYDVDENNTALECFGDIREHPSVNDFLEKVLMIYEEKSSEENEKEELREEIIQEIREKLFFDMEKGKSPLDAIIDNLFSEEDREEYRKFVEQKRAKQDDDEDDESSVMDMSRFFIDNDEANNEDKEKDDYEFDDNEYLDQEQYRKVVNRHFEGRGNVDYGDIAGFVGDIMSEDDYRILAHDLGLSFDDDDDED